MAITHEVKANVVKVSVGPVTQNRVARILRAGAPVPEGVDPAQIQALEDRGLIVKVKGSTKAAVEYAEGSDPAGFNVDVIKAYVGEDPALATAVLTLEQGRGDKARPTLVEWLTSVAGTGSGSGSE